MNNQQTLRTLETPEAIVGRNVPANLEELIGQKLTFLDPVDGIETRGEVLEVVAGFLVVDTEITAELCQLIAAATHSADTMLDAVFAMRTV